MVSESWFGHHKSPQSLLPTIIAAIHSIDPEIAISDPLNDAPNDWRFTVSLSASGFGMAGAEDLLCSHLF